MFRAIFYLGDWGTSLLAFEATFEHDGCKGNNPLLHSSLAVDLFKYGFGETSAKIPTS